MAETTPTATHTTWCARQHDTAEVCLSAVTRFPSLAVSAWLGQTSAGPRVVIDTAGPITGTPEQIAAFGAWLAQLAEQTGAGETR